MYMSHGTRSPSSETEQERPHHPNREYLFFGVLGLRRLPSPEALSSLFPHVRRQCSTEIWPKCDKIFGKSPSKVLAHSFSREIRPTVFSPIRANKYVNKKRNVNFLKRMP